MSSRARAWLVRLAGTGLAAALLLSAVGWDRASDVPTKARLSTGVGLAPFVAAGRPSVATHARTARRRVFVIGDSLTLGTEPWLAAALHREGWSLTGVDARVGRPVPEGLSILRRRAHRLPSTVVIALGTNDLGAPPAAVAGWLRTARRIVGPRRLVWVNLCLDASVQPQFRGFRHINASLDELAPRFGVQIAHWCSFASQHGITPGPDGIHYTPAAYRLRAWFYAAALADTARSRAIRPLL
jgi:lysophospholipase L1-like esterase